MSASNQILDAIELLIKDSVKKAAYDKTIQAQIISCEDQTIGKYKCRYQDAIIYAYSGNADVSYSKNSQVYILVPGNDMQKEKTILGATQKLGINYISQVDGEDAYDIVGNNNIKTNRTFYLDTKIQEGYIQTIYKKNLITNLLTINEKALKEYLKKSSSIIIGAYFKTDIELERQYRGHYGIRMALSFKDNATGKSTIRSFVLDQDNMVNNPYRLPFRTRQYEIFNIDGQNFESLESIEIFCSEFPESDETPKQKTGLLQEGDIEITSLQLYGANRMTTEEINGVAISFVTSQGTFFDENNKSDKTITAQVKIKGKVASSAQNIQYYWGMEDNRITPKSEYYNKYLGRGWKCLNEKNLIKQGTKTSDPVVDWKSAKETYIMKFSDAIVKDNRIKVAIFYDGTVVTKEINIQNLTSNIPKVTIESSGGTQFYYDIGHPDLTCKVNGVQKSNYSYYWSYTSNTGFFENLDTTTKENTAYDRAIDNLTKIQNEIKKGYAKQKATELQDRKDAVTAFNLIQRVKSNHIYDVQINKIVSFGTFKCSVYNGEVYLGTASITLTNKLEGEGVYSLVINNGSETFQYDQAGVSPTSGSKQTPQQLEALSFTIYDNLGQPIEDKSNKYKIKWEFPIKNTLLQNKNGKETGVSSDGNYKYYNSPTLIYGIAKNYNISSQRNQIKLTVDYNNMHLVSSTSFSFVKQGEAGTNGTDYVVKIVPNTTNPPLFPIITYNQASGGYSDNVLTTTETNSYSKKQLLKVELWKSGELQNFDIKQLKWEILKNNYGNNKTDFSAFTITEAGEISYKNFLTENGQTDSTVASACIIKCSITIDEKTYYGTIPIITAKIKNSNYKIRLKDYTGFRYVMYSDSGLFPQYDKNNPFEFICEQKINGVWQDVSLAEGNYRKDFSYRIIGNYYSNGNQSSSNLLSFATSSGLQPNQRKLTPASKYNGVCINNSLVCSCYGYDGNNVKFLVAKINVPIHFLLNKYGLANINAWDGNSVQINKDGGFILSPQVGAGTKDENNNFTGILIGEVRYQNRTENGLLGYGKGERTIFLNSKNGSATFGKSGKGQIVIDPTKDQEALIYGGNYSTKNGTGMLINLSDPSINFGSGKFNVNNQGHLTAKGGGQIAGWKIGTETIDGKVHDILYSNKTKSNGRITLDSYSNGKIYSHSHDTLSSSSTGFYLSYDGLSIGSKIKISNTGVVTVGPGAVTGKGAHWTINGYASRAYIAYGGTTRYDADTTGKSSDVSKVYLGTDGISLGRRFTVTKNGYLTANEGKIGGWTIDSGSLSSKENSSKQKIEIKANGEITGGKYSSGKSGWQITSSGYAEFNNATIRGTVTADGGSIGGWKIKNNTLLSSGSSIKLDAGNQQIKVGSIKLDAGNQQIKVGSITIGFTQKGKGIGSITSKELGKNGWSIDGEGNATFNQGIFGPWRINKKENAFQGSTDQSKSILFWANGNVRGQDISSSSDKNKNYWQIIDSKAYFGNGLLIGPMKYKANKEGWNINSTRILSYSDKATIQIGPDGNTATIKYTTEGKRPAIALGSTNIIANVDGKLTAKSADIATSATFKGNVTFGKNGSVNFNGGVNKSASLSAYIKKIINGYVDESFLKKIVNKKYLQDYLKATSSLSNVVTSSNKLSGTVSGTNVTISGYERETVPAGLTWKE